MPADKHHIDDAAAAGGDSVSRRFWVETLSVPHLKERGWSESLIKTFLGQPDWAVVNPHYKTGPKMRLYDPERVAKAEGNLHWQRKQAGGKGSRYYAIPADDLPIPTLRTAPPAEYRDVSALAKDRRKALAQAQAMVGVSVGAIAQELGVTVKTVKQYLDES